MNSRKLKSRRSRNKAKKPKFLSLSLQLSPEESKAPGKSAEVPTSAAAGGDCHQLDLFPPHPENLVEEKYTYTHDQENVAYFFSAGDGGATTTLTGLLNASNITTSSSNNNDNSVSLSPSASLTYAYGGHNCQNSELARTALRNKEREPSEEKWVYYSEVVEKKVKEEEVTSGADDLRWKASPPEKTQKLSLKLDYQDILNAWSDKGPLYIHADTPQTVPDINDDFFAHGVSWGGLWTVPEMFGNGGIGMKKEEEMKLGQREASVLRYKEKRQNRLFAKKIRYQVRKLNAEKRPRVKGRFVKRN